MTAVSIAICTYNRADRLSALVAALRAQECDLPFEILFIDNNSTDGTAARLASLAQEPGANIRIVFEPRQGIVFARNRAIEECLNSQYLFFMDDDELPMPGWLTAGLDALQQDKADCTGGRIRVNFAPYTRPPWLGDELLGFLAEVDHSDAPFWVTESSSSIWTANVAYRMGIFIEDPSLRFDPRYNREGDGVGGGEDAILFQELLRRKARIRYRPDMVVEHFVEPWRLKRGYFLRLHYRAGMRFGQYQKSGDSKSIAGVPLYLVRQAASQSLGVISLLLRNKSNILRNTMNIAYTLGQMRGRFLQ